MWDVGSVPLLRTAERSAAAEAAAEGGDNPAVEPTSVMARWHNVYADGHAHFCTSAVRDWQPLLLGDDVHILYEAWNAARTALTVKILAYVVMPDHYHIVLWSESGRDIMRFLRRTLSATAQRIRQGGGLWKERPHVLPLHSESVLRAKVDYLHRNPLRKKLVTNPEDWEHSSFRQIALGSSDVAFACDDWGGMSI